MPKDVQERWKSLSEANSNMAIIERINNSVNQADVTQTANPFEGLIDHDASRARSTLENKLKTQCLKWIKAGALKAYGFPTPRKVSDAPSEVPADLWEGIVIWSKNRIEANGLRMEAVRIVLGQPQEEDLTKKPGRPSRKEEILLAYSHLKEHGTIDFDAGSLKAIGRQVQDYLISTASTQDASTKGIGEKAIERLIREDVNAEKQARSKL